jgi:hypothetical protein
MRILIWLLGVLLLSPAHAQKGDSVMFQEVPPPFMEAPAPDGDDAGEECARMLKEMDELKGRPQQRHAMSERYQAECQRDQAPAGR